MSSGIICENVTVELSGREILSDVSFHIPDKTLTIVFGPNGAGKSTLLRVLTGQQTIVKGRVLLSGLSPEQARSRVGYVPQQLSIPAHYPISVLDAVLMGSLIVDRSRMCLNKASHERARWALETVELHLSAHAPVQSLSGGQMQRMLLARALAGDPKILLLDEATSGVDVGVKESLYELLTRLKKEMTILFVTHDVSVVSPEVDCILCLNRTLVSHGSPGEALTDEALHCMYGDGVAFFSHCHAPHIHVHAHQEKTK